MLLHILLVFPILLLALLMCGILIIPTILCGCSEVLKYHRNVTLALDQTFNALFGGDEDESISSRAGKRVDTQKWAYYLCRMLHILDPDHCEKSIEKDEGDRQVLDD